MSQIEANFRAIRKLAGAGVTVMPVVKADAYRHGAVEVSRALEAAGARWLDGWRCCSSLSAWPG